MQHKYSSPVALSGSHWFVIFQSSQDVAEVFNSLGSTAAFVSSVQNKLKRETFIEFNTTQLQCCESVQCGEFCVYFIVNRLLSLDMEFIDILNEIFVPDCKENEKVVKQFADFLEAKH